MSREGDPYDGPILWDRDEDFRAGIEDGVHSGKHGGSIGNERGRVMASGFHHIALVAKSLEEQIKFYEGALG